MYIIAQIVLLGVLYDDKDFAPGDGARVGALYLLFNVLLYGGIYTMNQITDLVGDREHSRKRGRPIAAGLISVRLAWVFVLGAWAAALAGAAALHGARLVSVFAAFIAINVLYSTWARGVPFVDVACNSATYALRLYMGGIICGRPPTAAQIAAVYCLGAMMVTSKRVIERRVAGWNARKALHGMPTAALLGIFYGALAAIVGLAWANGGAGGHGTLMYARVIGVAVLMVHGTHAPSPRNTAFLVLALGLTMLWSVPVALAHSRIFFVLDSCAILAFVVLLSFVKSGGIAAIFEKAFTF